MASMSLPLFPLGLVLYPGVVLPLHIFEPRYRRLVQELLDMPDGSRLFGVVAIKAGREVGVHGVTALHEIGCTAELRYAEAYEDGRFDIIATGTDRFRLIEVDDADLMRAEVELLPELTSAATESAAVRVRRLFGTYRQALQTAQGLPVDVDKQVLLGEATVDERLRLERDLLKREASMVSGLSMRPAVELPRMPYTAN